MARMRVFMVFVLAMTAGGALAFGTYNYMQRLPAASASIPTRPVVVARPTSTSAPSCGARTSASSTGRPTRCPPTRSAIRKT